MDRWGWFAVVLGAAACTTNSTASYPSADSGAEEASPAEDAGNDGADDGAMGGPDARPDVRGDGGTCTTIALLGSLVPGTFVASAPPSGAGGMVADGTYVLTKYQLYTGTGGLSGPTGQSLQTTIRLTAGVYESVSTSSVDPTQARVKGTYAVSAPSFQWSLQCPAAASGNDSYTSDGATTFVQLSSIGSTTMELTFTRQ
jgi:hypothetical protein